MEWTAEERLDVIEKIGLTLREMTLPGSVGIRRLGRYIEWIATMSGSFLEGHKGEFEEFLPDSTLCDSAEKKSLEGGGSMMVESEVNRPGGGFPLDKQRIYAAHCLYCWRLQPLKGPSGLHSRQEEYATDPRNCSECKVQFSWDDWKLMLRHGAWFKLQVDTSEFGHAVLENERPMGGGGGRLSPEAQDLQTSLPPDGGSRLEAKSAEIQRVKEKKRRGLTRGMLPFSS